MTASECKLTINEHTTTCADPRVDGSISQIIASHVWETGRATFTASAGPRHVRIEFQRASSPGFVAEVPGNHVLVSWTASPGVAKPARLDDCLLRGGYGALHQGWTAPAGPTRPGALPPLARPAKGHPTESWMNAQLTTAMRNLERAQEYVTEIEQGLV